MGYVYPLNIETFDKILYFVMELNYIVELVSN